jgi:intracellular multiplication protein IcmV
MAVKDIFKVSFKTFINPMGWFGYKSVKGSVKTTWDLSKELFVVPEPKYIETFSEALIRLNVTEAELEERKKDYFFYALLFLFLAVFSFFFGCYLLVIKGTLAGFLLGVGVTMMFLAQAFRYHFWYFQIIQRKLGCTFDEWKNALFGQRPKT